jgi:hypothetical protein
MVQVGQGNFGRGIALRTRGTKSPTKCVSFPEEQDNEEDFDFHRAVGTSELWVCK